MHEKRTPPEEPPCVTCRIDPMAENRDALRVFFIVRNQFIMGFNGPITLNHLAIDAAMERMGIKDRQDCFNRITQSHSDKRPSLGNWWIDRIREKNQ